MRSFYLAPTTSGTGLTSACLGLVRALDQIGVRVAFFKPVAQIYGSDSGSTRSTELIKQTVGLQSGDSVSLSYAQQKVANGDFDTLMEEVITNYQVSCGDADVMVIEGLVPRPNEDYIARLNQRMAATLGSEVIIVTAKKHYTSAEWSERINITASIFGGFDNPRLLGCIINKVGAPPKGNKRVSADDNVSGWEVQERSFEDFKRKTPVFNHKNFRCLGIIHWNPHFVAPRTQDIANSVSARIVNAGQMDTRRVSNVVLCARTVPNMLYALKAGTLIVTPGDRIDILLAASQAVLNGVPLAGILFTGEMVPDEKVLQLCRGAFNTGLPVLVTRYDSLETVQLLDGMNNEVPADDVPRMLEVMDEVARSIDIKWLAERAALPQDSRMSPPAFRHHLMTLAQSAAKKIVLPEGNEPRTIQAAIECTRRKIAQCLLLGDREEITLVAEANGLVLPDDIEILDPATIRPRYIQPMMELRKHKDVSAPQAEALLEDKVVLGTMMLAQDEVDGLVSGAVHTTANTIRPALQLIKTRDDTRLVSSIFFMLMPDQVLVYGDCAVNPNPNAEDLADIAISSADSAKAFGIEPRVAMISYSTGVSGVGSDVDKVREATEIARKLRPDLVIDGPLQYDAAAIASVAASKAPDSPVAGKATVFVFPDLNTGNTTYKAVQRSANVVSVGPVLQGLKKPVNDLSRGALVEDIVYTIALTAIQAEQNNN
ncbi:phosphate acetyltransferase [Teredinibacter franksiae]|jgi:phosphotransacetylase (EC 2.3.1.8)|uniref:phosphate acetyltransferase n=1 Tax=Teredinibacter franksiae TaxID=2761453 RepID=UPI001624043B|nr:phosphate acetyltransferase [Teredinibacter franksiae]